MKKVLVISYYFPPMGMGGVQRTAKFVKYLSHFGWQPYVLTVTPKMYLASDKCLLHEVETAGAKIFRTGKPDVNGAEHKVVKFKKDSNRKVLSNISQMFLVPDSKILWKNTAIELAEKIINKNGIDMLYATAPPYTDFLIARELKEKYRIPMVIDYRDSWIDCPNNFYPTPLHKNMHRKMETRVLEDADKIITINERIKELITMRYPFVSENDIAVIPQGFDPDDFNRTFAASEKPEGKMRITYSGSFLNYYTPEFFINGLKSAIEKNPEIKNNIEACFIGTFPTEYKEYIEKLGLSGNVMFTGYVEHSVCTKYLMESDVLWMMINKTERSDLHSTGKLYEYFGTGKPILACIPDGVARISLKDYGAVIMTEPNDRTAISEAILKFYDQFKAGNLPKPNSQMTSMYDRKLLTGKLADEFNLHAGVKTEELKAK
ncbi:MAG: glycosyltransferase family 4 protein [Ignavibacteria bacterium]|nr:glycosyltransferase family 4 protein [Ignavibacteria bacterium]